MPDMPVHIYDGLCPDVANPRQLDPDCPACQLLRQCSASELSSRLTDLGAEMVYLSHLLVIHGGYDIDAIDMLQQGERFDRIGMEMLKNA